MQATKHFGIAELRRCWEGLLTDHPSEAQAVRIHTERILGNIERAIKLTSKHV